MLSHYAPTVALIVLTVLAVRGLVWAAYATLLRPAKNLKRSFGEWAMVTGATDGIGKGLAFELAKRGLNVVLVSRSLTKLNEVADELTKKYPKVQTKVLAVDFSHFDAAAQGKVRSLVEALEIGTLINNVGMSYPYPTYFAELSHADVQAMIALNVTSTTLMTHIVLPKMVERKRGAIVCISSAASQLPANPLLAQYAAAKAYVDKFAESLSSEYASQGIRVQVQNPLYVTSKLSKIRKASLTVPSPAAYARCAVNAIGYDSQISPFFLHAAQLWAMSLLPRSLLDSQVISMHKAIRRRALKKAEAEQTNAAADKTQ